MANSVTRAIKKAEEDIQQLGKETTKLIQDLDRVQKSAASIRGRLGKAISIDSKKTLKKPVERLRKNNDKNSFRLQDLHEIIENVPEDLTSALKKLKEVRAWLKIEMITCSK